MHERKFYQTSFSRWSKLWSIHHERFELDQRLLYKYPRSADKFSSSIRYPDPAIKVNDTVKIDLATGKITDFIKFDTGVIAMVTGGRNMGRVGVITHRERHDGGFNIVHIKDAIDNSFATRENNVFVIGSEKPWVSLPKGKGVKLTIAEERDRRRAHAIAGQ
jgi:small subunit ribosomal protein S4e